MNNDYLQTEGSLVKEIDIAVLDVETTGFRPGDKIVEIAILKLNREGKISRTFQSLLNPLRDVGPTHIHGITPSMVKDAPGFRDLADDLLSVIPPETLIVGHNVQFDLKFIERELFAATGKIIQYKSFCTLEESRKYIPAASFKLENLCRLLKIEHIEKHSALGDALATWELFNHLLESLKKETGSDLLFNFKERTVFQLESVNTVQRQSVKYLKPDKINIRESLIPFDTCLKGKSVCFTGSTRVSAPGMDESGSTFLSRRRLERIAELGGLIVKSNVSKSLDLLVASDKDSLSGKARKARTYGIQILDEREFWNKMNLLL